MIKNLKPDYWFTHYRQIDTKWMIEHGFRTILSDLDETLATHDTPYNEEFSNWYKQLERDGFALIIISNNTQKRVDEFVTPFSIVGYGKCKKPGTEIIEQQLFYKGLDPNTTLFLGDQIFTDMWCAHRLGIKKALVKPLGGTESKWFMKCKRKLENYIIKKWKTQLL